MTLRRRAVAMAAVGTLLAASPAGAAGRFAALASPAPGVAGTCPYADQTPASATVSELATGVRCLLNQQRAAHGVRPAVVPKERLGVAAKRHAADMVARHYFAHTSLGGATLTDRIRRAGYLPSQGRWSAGEILAWASGSQATPRGLVDAWMASPEHRRILLDPKFSDVGVGVVAGSPQGGQGTAITADADFGRIG